MTKNEYFDNIDKSFNFYQITDSFDGIVLVVNQQNEAVQFSSFKNSLLIKSRTNGRMAIQTCVYLGWMDDYGDFTAISLVGCFGGGGAAESDNNNGGYPPHVGGGGSSSTNTQPVVYDKITNELTGKAKCLNALLDKNGDSFVKNLLANFKGKSEFNIQIVSKDKVTTLDENGIIKEINGKTIYTPGSTLLTIEISTIRTDEHSALEAARTILHEYVHADIFRKLNTASSLVGERAVDFKTTYDAYGNQHGVMASLYINSMKEALKEFHKTVLTNDYNGYVKYFEEEPSDAFYEAMAWNGLKENNVKAWVDLPADKKASIESLVKRGNLLTKTAPCPN